MHMCMNSPVYLMVQARYMDANLQILCAFVLVVVGRREPQTRRARSLSRFTAMLGESSEFTRFFRLAVPLFSSLAGGVHGAHNIYIYSLCIGVRQARR